MDFTTFFQQATADNLTPYPYQEAFATGQSLPELLNIPTGLGKTETVVLGWLWRRFEATDDIRLETPRRLIYCLPMRVLVEQTLERTQDLLDQLASVDNHYGDLSVYPVMGGRHRTDWILDPHEEQILVGTQDMLLSRALNRGYASSRFRWPIEYGLLNNDVLWVMDEVQVMGSGRSTSVQLAAFREKWGSYGPQETVWMSATCEPDWLQTVDRSAPTEDQVQRLTEADRNQSSVEQRWSASKPLESAGASLESQAKSRLPDYIDAVGEEVVDYLQGGGSPSQPLVLVVMNTVERAKRLYRHLREEMSDQIPDLQLIHSRFRPSERKYLNEMVSEAPGSPSFPDQGRIIVATQVIEAGVDLSSDCLITELAPWSSLVQRFGRINRDGHTNQPNVIWVDIDTEGRNAEELSLPYDPDELDRARQHLGNLDDVSPEHLQEERPESPDEGLNVIRRRDLRDLFDTTPDLAGNEIDVSPYIRDVNERDVQVYWRDWDRSQDAPPDELDEAQREELCSVPIGSFQDFLDESSFAGWDWDHLSEEWTRVRPTNLRPGQTVLLHAMAGGYDEELGWSEDTGDRVEPLALEDAEALQEESTSGDPQTFTGEWTPLSEHSQAVAGEMERLLDEIDWPGLEPEWQEALRKAALLHDAGKAHPVFQQALKDLAEESPHPGFEQGVYAKSGESGRLDFERRYFRHELVSGLWLLEAPDVLEDLTDHLVDLVIYLVAAHHGKVRLSIRSLPDEPAPDATGSDENGREEGPRRYARGVWDEDELPKLELNGVTLPSLKLDLSPMELGENPWGDSWLQRMQRLRDDDSLGPFRLAALEALVRLADQRVSSPQKSPQTDVMTHAE